MVTEIIFPGVLPGNNGKDGLIRIRGRARTALKNACFWQIRSSTTNQHKGPVRLELVRHSIGGLMDRDNLVSTGKIPIDALVKAKVIPDDNPTIITESDYSQTRAKNQATQFTVIRIIDL